jgi:hypothetical protein
MFYIGAEVDEVEVEVLSNGLIVQILLIAGLLVSVL